MGRKGKAPLANVSEQITGAAGPVGDTRVTNEAVAMLGITKRFGPVRANENITFIAQKGEVHELIGENGAGKSTLMRILERCFSEISKTCSTLLTVSSSVCFI